MVAVPAESLTFTEQAPVSYIPAESITVAGQVPYGPDSIFIPAEALTFTEQAPVSYIPAESITVTAKHPVFTPIPPLGVEYVPAWRVYLDLAGDRFELPCSSLSLRLQYNASSYAGVVIPNASQYVDEIEARSEGNLLIYYGYRVGDDETLGEIFEGPINDIRLDEGGESYSAGIDSYQIVSDYTPKQWGPLTGSYRSVTNDIVTAYRAISDFYLRPGDLLTLHDSTEIIVGAIVHTIGPDFHRMEVQELDDSSVIGTSGDTVDVNGVEVPVLDWQGWTGVSS